MVERLTLHGHEMHLASYIGGYKTDLIAELACDLGGEVHVVCFNKHYDTKGYNDVFEIPFFQPLGIAQAGLSLQAMYGPNA